RGGERTGDQRRDARADRRPAVQRAERLAAVLRGNDLAQQYRAHRPFGAEPDPLQHADREELLIALRETGREREERKPQDRDLQDPRAPEPVAQPAADPAPNRRREIARAGDRARLGQRHAEADDQERDQVLVDEPVGAIHRPAGAAGPEHPPRLAVRLAIPAEHSRHATEPPRKFATSRHRTPRADCYSAVCALSSPSPTS